MIPSLKCINFFLKFSSHPFDSWKPSIFTSLPNSKVFSWSRAPLISMFSLGKTSNHFFNTLLSVSFFFHVFLLWPQDYFHMIGRIALFFFPCVVSLHGHTKRWNNIVVGSAFLEFFQSFKLDFQRIIWILVLCCRNGRTHLWYGFCLMKIGKFNAISESPLAFDIWFDIPSG